MIKEYNIIFVIDIDLIELSNGNIYLQGGLPVPYRQINKDLIAL